MGCRILLPTITPADQGTDQGTDPTRPGPSIGRVTPLQVVPCDCFTQNYSIKCHNSLILYANGFRIINNCHKYCRRDQGGEGARLRLARKTTIHNLAMQKIGNGNFGVHSKGSTWSTECAQCIDMVGVDVVGGWLCRGIARMEEWMTPA